MRSVDVKSPIKLAEINHHHPPDSQSPAGEAKSITRKIRRNALINRLNFLHFQSAPLTLLLKHRRHRRLLRLFAEPQPCQGSELTCYWSDPPPASVRRGEFILSHLEVPYGHHVLQVLVNDPVFTDDGLTCQLPEHCQELAFRKTRRHFCQDVRARVIQNSTIFSGKLIDFSAQGFRLELTAEPPQTFHWLDSANPVNLILERKGQTQLIINGNILRRQGNRLQQSIVIQPIATAQHRFPNKKQRSRRLELRPSPLAVFSHPLTGQTCRLDVRDLSGAGFEVVETPEEALLLPGMALNNLELQLNDSMTLCCQAQVVHCDTTDTCNGLLRRGIAILDMTLTDHTQLMALLHRAENRHKGVCPHIDVDRLWEFFFDSGFIYPKKYDSIQEHRKDFREIYSRLYGEAPEIARHFIYQENSRITGHLAMLRTHSNSWLLQHHASDRSHSHRAGLDTLQFVGEAINESLALYSSHMDYVMCYFRPDNRFPQRVFGGVASHYDNPSDCSIDTLAYFHYEKKFDLKWRDNGPWALSPARNEDLLNLEAFYQAKSGGLMLNALDLNPERPDEQEVNTSYEMAGFQRQQALFALRRNGSTVALFVVLRTEVGLNLSNLTNAITVLVLDPNALSREAFFTAISMLAAKFPQRKIPILTFPKDYVAAQGIAIEKHYNLWVLNCRNTDPYVAYCNNLFRRLSRSTEYNQEGVARKTQDNR